MRGSGVFGRDMLQRDHEERGIFGYLGSKGVIVVLETS